MLYIVNASGYYFKVLPDPQGQPSIDCAQLNNCSVFENPEQMYATVCARQNLDLDEVEGFEIGVRLGADRRYETSESRGLWFPVELAEGQTIEQYIASFTL
ncbi:MAG: hypothetical protein C9356_15090 [Oleiphilus sp.]|nr:MAG: hypothetical protein C9356_15090 [Oleiphilus sp.]